MALTATISVSPSSSAVTEQKVTATLTISNSAAFPIPLQSIAPFARITSGGASLMNTGVSISPINFGPNANITVPATGTNLVLTFDIKFHAPSTGVLSNGTNTFDVGATCYGTDGQVFAPTVTTIKINNVVSYDASQS